MLYSAYFYIIWSSSCNNTNIIANVICVYPRFWCICKTTFWKCNKILSNSSSLHLWIFPNNFRNRNNFRSNKNVLQSIFPSIFSHRQFQKLNLLFEMYCFILLNRLPERPIKLLQHLKTLICNDKTAHKRSHPLSMRNNTYC